jgi:hypothetical protein
MPVADRLRCDSPVVIIVPVIIALVALGVALATRQAANVHARGGGWVPLSFPPTLAGFCPFQLDNTWLTTQEFAKSETQPDGTVVTQITGSLKVAVTNHETGKTATYNISGPGTLTVSPDGSTFLVAEGSGIQFFLPAAQQQFNLPAVAYIKGRYTEATDAQGNVTGFIHDGATISDVCAALS